MRKIRLVLEYDGTDFAGWQRQPKVRTVQAELERVLAAMTHAPVVIQGAGRTDAGVHARAQVATFLTETNIPLEGLRRGINGTLGKDLAVTAIDEVPFEFDARRSARGKHYVYRIWNQPSRSPLRARFAWHLYRPLDVDRMAEAGRLLLGQHDFSAFRAVSCDRKNPVRVLRRLEPRFDEPGLLAIHLEATAFLRNMARIIAGTLVEVGLGTRPVEDVAQALASRDRSRAGKTAPPHGLMLERVVYEP